VLCVVAVADARTFEVDLFGDDLLTERGLAHCSDDRRAAGEVLAHQVEQADLVLVDGLDDELPGTPSSSVKALLAHLVRAPATVRSGPHEVSGRELLNLHADPRRNLARADPLAMAPTGAPDADGVWTLDLRTWRPLHPQRLHEEVEAVATAGTRSRGRFWLPGRPAVVGAWDGGGGQLSLGDVGYWDKTERSTRLVVTGMHPALRAHVAAAFDRVALTDAELARGRDWWVARDDGFDQWLGARDAA